MSFATVASDLSWSRSLLRRLEGVGWPVLVLIGLLVLVARRPEALFAAEFNWEEGNAFFAPTFFSAPGELIIEPWGGYLQVVPRLGYEVLRVIPVYWAPLAENLLALAALLSLAGFIASPRMAAVVPSTRVRILFAALLLLMPAQGDVMGAFLSIQWYGALWLVLVGMTSPPASGVVRWIERLLVGLFSLSGPFSALLAPLFLWRLRRTRTAYDLWLAAIMMVGGLTQLVAAVTAGRTDVLEPRPLEMSIATFALHTTIVPLLGEGLGDAIGNAGMPTTLLFGGGVLLIVMLGVMAVRTMPARVLPLAYGTVAVGLSGIAVHGGANVWPPGTNERYFLLGATLVIVIVVTGLMRRSRLAVPLAVVLAIGIVSDFRLSAYPPQGWDQSYSCIGRGSPCVVPIWPRDYDIHWPGIDGDYRMPQHVDP